jgi:hypothetical protein
MDGITQCQTEIGRLRGILRENEAGYAEALEQERAADTDTRRAFCAGMGEGYKNALAILAGQGEEA